MPNDLITINQIHEAGREMTVEEAKFNLALLNFTDTVTTLYTLLNRISDQGIVGPPGPKGETDWAKLDDATKATLIAAMAALVPKGDPGPKGEQGEKGDPAEWDFAGHFDYDSADKVLNPEVAFDLLRAVGIDIRRAVSHTTLTQSGTFTAPKSSLYRVTMIGGGGGGQTGLGDQKGVPTDVRPGQKCHFGTLTEDGIPIPRPEHPWAPGKTPGGATDPGDIALYQGGTLAVVDDDADEANLMHWRFMEEKAVSDTETHPIFVNDRNILAGVSHNDLKRAGFVDGLTVVIDGVMGILRLMDVGDSQGDTDNEWNRYILNEGHIAGVPTPNATDLDGALTADDFAGISNRYWHWGGMYTLGKNFYQGNEQSNSRARRGNGSPAEWHDTGASNGYDTNGLRLVFEITDPDYAITPGVSVSMGGYGGAAGEVTVMEVHLNEGDPIPYEIGQGGVPGGLGGNTTFGDHTEMGHGGWHVKNNEGANGGPGQDNGTGYGSGGGGGGGYQNGLGAKGAPGASDGHDASDAAAGQGGTGQQGAIKIDWFNGCFKVDCPWGASAERLQAVETLTARLKKRIRHLAKALRAKDVEQDGRLDAIEATLASGNIGTPTAALKAVVSATMPQGDDWAVWVKAMGAKVKMPADWAITDAQPTPPTPQTPNTVLLMACAPGEGYGVSVVHADGTATPIKNLADSNTNPQTQDGDYILVH